MELSLLKKDDVSIMRITGDVTANTGEAIEKAYHQVSQDGAKKILLCFDRNSYINSGGIAILIGIAAESRENAQTIRMTGLSDHFKKIFHMMGLTKYTEIFPSEESALKDFN